MMTGIEKQVAVAKGVTDAQFEAARTVYLARHSMNLEQYYSLSPEEVEVIEKSGISSTEFNAERARSMAEEIVDIYRESIGSDIEGLSAIEAQVAEYTGIAP